METPSAPDLDTVRAAQERIRGFVRRTPLLRTRFLQRPPPGDVDLRVKLENLQVTGSFKVRGAVNRISQLSEAERARGVVTASGGNHGLAVAYAARASGTNAVVYIPKSATEDKRARLAAFGTEVVVRGDVWDDAQGAALEHAEREGSTYVHPYAHPHVVAGQGTLGVEMLDQTKSLDAMVIAVGGGGLIGGVAAAAKAIRPECRIVGVEPVGAPTLTRSLEAGKPVVLDRIETAAGTLAPRRTELLNFELARDLVDEWVLVDDDAMKAAARWLWLEMGVAAELAGAAAVAAILQKKVPGIDGATVAAIVCGAGVDGVGAE